MCATRIHIDGNKSGFGKPLLCLGIPLRVGTGNNNWSERQILFPVVCTTRDSGGHAEVLAEKLSFGRGGRALCAKVKADFGLGAGGPDRDDISFRGNQLNNV